MAEAGKMVDQRRRGVGRAAIAIFIIAVLVLGGVSVYLITTQGSVANQTCIDQSSSSTSSSNAQGHNIADAVTPDVYFNGSIYQGEPPVTFAVKPGSHATVVVEVSYPWQNAPPPSALGFCVDFSFTIGPFQANSNASTIPSWMHVSLSAPSVEIPYGSSASVDLLASVDGTAPSDSGASFELLIHFLDPASGNFVTGNYVVSIRT